MDKTEIMEVIEIIKEIIEEREKKYERVIPISTARAWLEEIVEAVNRVDCEKERICENCVHHENYRENDKCIDGYDDKYCSMIGINTPDYFGCNRFERR